MAAANTSTKTAAEQAKTTAAAASKAATDQAKSTMAAATKAATENAAVFTENANKAAEETLAQIKANAEKATKAAEEALAQLQANAEEAREGSVQLTDKALERFEEGNKLANENAARLREFNNSVAESSKAGSRAVVDQVETATKGLLDLQRKLAGTSQVAWVKDTAATQIQLAEDITAAWAKAARELLK